MSSAFCLTVHFLDPVASFHGRRDGDEAEWPPSPLRLFQALVAASAARWREGQFADYAQPALNWLEAHTPIVVAPSVQTKRTPYRMYVPNNAADLVTSAWSRGNADASIAELRIEKDVRPTRLVGGDSVHYLWNLPEPVPANVLAYVEALAAAARGITHLGWGVDMVAANAGVKSTDEAANLRGHVWRPVPVGGTPLRVPVPGTLAALIHRHGRFLLRLAKDVFQPVPPLSTFANVGYHSATVLSERQVGARPFAAFSILKPDASGNQSFDTPRRARDVAAWLRHVTGQVCEGWPFRHVGAFVHGHDANGNPLKGDGADRRFMYLPLPTINLALNRVEAIRRVLIAAPPGFQEQLDWVRRRLPGQELQNLDGQPVGLLNILPNSDWVLRQYVCESRLWSTVTPVIWPGHDDHDARKAEGILRKAFMQAGLSPELIAAIEELDWRPVGFRAGVDLADRYRAPDKIRGRQYHVRVRFSHPIRGPLAIGAGRYRGLGVFAAEGTA
jgi:CRISPR-associated protein Csb2